FGFYLTIYLGAFAICWGSLAVLLKTGGRFVSVLSWSLFSLEEIYRYYLGGARAAAAPATLVAAALIAVGVTAVAALARRAMRRVPSWIFLLVIVLAALIWFPNPWESM